jgi:peptidoglycan/LPS O-acetylase OafA/YrhL
VGDRLRAAAGALGVVVLTAAWSTAGLLTDGFDPVRQSISQLQREGTATGTVMTAALIVFAAGTLLVSPVLGRRVSRPVQRALVLVGLATLGAAVSPLGEVRGGAQDAVHLAFGATGYLSLSLLPLLAGWALRHRSRIGSAGSYALGIVTSACLLGTVPADAVSGVLQRTGFVAGHLWLLLACLAVLSGGLPPTGRSQDASGSAARGRGAGRRSA